MLTDIIFREDNTSHNVEEDSLVTLKKNIDLIRELENTYQMVEQETNKLHIRFASIISEKPLYELSIEYDLLDDMIKDELNPFIIDYYISESEQNASEEMETYYGKVIEERNLDKVMKILGIEEIIDSTYRRDLFNKLYDLYLTSFSIINSLFQQGYVVTEYYGERYFPKLTASSFAYSLDTYEFYMMDYSKDSIPSISKILQNETILEAIVHLCIKASDLDFYSSS